MCNHTFSSIIIPKRINLGFDNYEQCYYHYISIVKTSEFNYYNDNILSDIQSGNVIKSNNFFNSNKNVLQIILYQDAFEVCNPLGDNLGSHQIGGITENFHSSEYFCRFCDITQNQLQLKYMCTNINRNPNNYNLLNHFHVCNPGLPPCMAHDLFEDIVPYDVMYCIKYFVKESWFTLDFLNFRLKKIKILNENAYNNVPLIKASDCKLTGTASQIKRLLLIFPLAVYDSIKNTEDNIYLVISTASLRQSQCSKDTYRSLVKADNAEEYIPENFNINISSIITNHFYENRNENCKYVASQITFRDSHYINVYFVGTTTEVIYNSDFEIYEPFEIKGQECNTDKILLYPSSLLIQHPVLETRLNSIPFIFLNMHPLNLLFEIINVKLGIAGSILIMEKDGTIIDENDVLQFCCAETFMEIWTNFRLPRDAIETAVLKELEIGKRNKYIIHTVVNHMDEDGNRFGDGIHMYLKLRDRNSYLNGPHMKRSLIQTLNIPLKKQKKKIWPILLQKEYMFWHYQKLIGHLINILKEQMLKKQTKILNYGRFKKYDIINSTDIIEIKLIKIMKHFKEYFNVLFKRYPVSLNIYNIISFINTIFYFKYN
ncbi:hypothetical protein ALC60_07491 [Trachymyrmex zeteki]|uniref:Uncharacterized protein n=1 Tax=Mycetomoellerius zeteki TaxID=64791 RepID=A0A151WZZ9_9HYME|nr:hypothetical protein ALC60_07491 [Trachymyrmex zeteki]